MMDITENPLWQIAQAESLSEPITKIIDVASMESGEHLSWNHSLERIEVRYVNAIYSTMLNHVYENPQLTSVGWQIWNIGLNFLSGSGEDMAMGADLLQSLAQSKLGYAARLVDGFERRKEVAIAQGDVGIIDFLQTHIESLGELIKRDIGLDDSPINKLYAASVNARILGREEDYQMLNEQMLNEQMQYVLAVLPKNLDLDLMQNEVGQWSENGSTYFPSLADLQEIGNLLIEMSRGGKIGDVSPLLGYYTKTVESHNWRNDHNHITEHLMIKGRNLGGRLEEITTTWQREMMESFEVLPNMMQGEILCNLLKNGNWEEIFVVIDKMERVAPYMWSVMINRGVIENMLESVWQKMVAKYPKNMARAEREWWHAWATSASSIRSLHENEAAQILKQPQIMEVISEGLVIGLEEITDWLILHGENYKELTEMLCRRVTKQVCEPNLLYDQSLDILVRLKQASVNSIRLGKHDFIGEAMSGIWNLS